MKIRLRSYWTNGVLATLIAMPGSACGRSGGDSQPDAIHPPHPLPTVKCSKLDGTGTVDPSSLKGLVDLGDGRKAKRNGLRELEAAELAATVGSPYETREACAALYDVLKEEGREGFNRRNPFALLSESNQKWSRSVQADGVGLIVEPSGYTGVEADYAIYEEAKVRCKDSSGRKIEVPRLKLVTAKFLARCAYPTGWRTQTPALAVKASPAVTGLSKTCIEKNPFKPGVCAEEVFAQGGILSQKSDNGFGRIESFVGFAWAIQSPDVRAIEDRVRSELDLEEASDLKVDVIASGIAESDRFPVRALGLSAVPSVDGVGYWGLPLPHASRADGIDDDPPLFPRVLSELGPSVTTLDTQGLKTLAVELSRATLASNLLMPWDQARNQEPDFPPSAMSNAIGKAFAGAIDATLAVNKPLYAFLVWTTSDEQRSVLTRVEVRPDGRLGKIESKAITDFAALGLPSDLLSK